MSWFEDRGYSVTLLVWRKTNPPPLSEGKYISDLEYIVYIREKGAYWNYSAPLDYKYKTKEHSIMTSSYKLHPTEKPVDILVELIDVHCPIDGTVLDPFMGSGSTGEACKVKNMNFIGIEIDKGFYDKAKDRLSTSKENLW